MRFTTLLVLLTFLMTGCNLFGVGSEPGRGSLVVRVESVPDGIDEVTIVLMQGDTTKQTKTFDVEDSSVNATFDDLRSGPWFVRVEARSTSDGIVSAYDWINIQTGKTMTLILDLAENTESKIVFVSTRDGASDIWVMDATGSNPINLTQSTSSDTQPALSPDGSKIAFRSNRDNGTHVFVMNSDGSNPINLSLLGGRRGETEQQPDWSPDGTKILFVSNYGVQNDSERDIFVMNADGSGVTALTREMGQNYNPKWSPDGTKIAFSSNRGGSWDIYVMNSDGSNPVNLTNNGARNNLGLDWSPDGTRIAFTSNLDGTPDIFVMNADGGDPVNLTNSEFTESSPSWSPDGTMIAFVSDRDGTSDIFVINADGSGEPIKLPGNSSANDSQPSWR